MKKVLTYILLFFLVACEEEIKYDYTFQNPNISINERVNDLISKLTLEEKASLMMDASPAIERLGIPEYNWWNESLHGVGRAGKATVFPQAIGMAATFDEDLIFRVADAISTEARAKYNQAVRKNNRARYLGLSFWTPNINIFRDPRWGRGQETYGEDPLLTSILGGAYVKGLQGDHPKYLKAAACAKHYVVHSGPEKIRHNFYALTSEKDFRETYLPAFQYLVQEANVEAVMCAYNGYAGKPCCGNEYLLNDILRKEWGFTGHVVSDCSALRDLSNTYKVADNRVDAAALAIKSGVNLNCADGTYKYIPEAVKKGLISEKKLDEVLAPLLRTRFKLGLFDVDEQNPYSNIKPNVVNCEKHKQLAYETAVKSIVLLKNKNNTLPLKRENLKNIFITGPTAADITCLLGNYNGLSGEFTTFLEGIVDKSDEGTIINYKQGILSHNDSTFNGIWYSHQADAVIVCVGISELYEGEEGVAIFNPDGGDRMDIGIPKNQLNFVKRVREQTINKPLIVVITGGSAMAIPEIDSLADAILFTWYPGEQGGNALADILYGDVNPSGKLPVTFYKSINDLPPFEDYNMEGRTYKYFRGEPLYSFGHGLSYTEFEYSNLNLNLNLNLNKIKLTVNIKNSGQFSGEEVVQVYAKKLNSDIPQPIKTLVAFARINLKENEEKTIDIDFDLKRLQYWDIENQQYKVEPGEYKFEVGSSSSDIKLSTVLEIK